MTYSVTAIKDRLTGQFESAGMVGRGYRAAYRCGDGPWKPCRVNRGAEGMVSLWFPTAEEAKAEAKAWLLKAMARKRKGLR